MSESLAVNPDSNGTLSRKDYENMYVFVMLQFVCIIFHIFQQRFSTVISDVFVYVGGLSERYLRACWKMDQSEFTSCRVAQL